MVMHHFKPSLSHLKRQLFCLSIFQKILFEGNSPSNNWKFTPNEVSQNHKQLHLPPPRIANWSLRLLLRDVWSSLLPSHPGLSFSVLKEEEKESEFDGGGGRMKRADKRRSRKPVVNLYKWHESVSAHDASLARLAFAEHVKLYGGFRQTEVSPD